MSDDIERHGALEARLWVTHNSKHVITPTIRALLAERDAAVARADAAEKWQTMWADKWTGAARLLAGAEHERREAQRLREGIEAHRTDAAWPRDGVHRDFTLWALLAEQPEGETPAFMDQSNLPDTPRDRPRNPVALTRVIPVAEQPDGSE